MGLLRLHAFWTKHRNTILRVSIVLLALYACAKLGDEFYRLTLRPDRPGAIDLKLRYREVHEWFAGNPVYGRIPQAVYPPATYAILWPFLGWMSLGAARWFWAATSAGALAWLAVLLVRESGAQDRPERWFVALMPLSLIGTGVCLGNGQLTIHLLPALLTGLVLMCRPGGSWGRDAAAAGLMAIALAKPSIAAPFFWIALFAPGRLRPAALTLLFYGLLTVGAAHFQKPGLFELMGQWLKFAPMEVAEQGYADLYKWMTLLGLKAYALHVSLAVLAAAGIWVYQHRRADLWLQLSVVAMVARLWTYHRQYDNMLLLPPMLVLFRVAREDAEVERRTAAGLLLALLLVALMLPARMLEWWPQPWPFLFSLVHTALFLAALVFLLREGQRRTMHSFHSTFQSFNSSLQ